MQLLYLTPKPPLVPTPPNIKDRPYIGAIFGTNILCFLLHLWLSRPSAGEATRGYLHGGLLIDFIGQKGPTSKMHLLLLDVGIAVLQMVMLAAVTEEKNMESKKKARSHRRSARNGTNETTTTTTNAATEPEPSEPITSTQDHDAEERGQRRSAESAPLLRMRELDSPGASTELLDRLTSGQAITAKFYVFDVVRDEWRAYGELRNASASQEQSVMGVSGAGLAAALARSSSAARLGIRRMASG